MKLKITKRSVESVKPGPKIIYVYDKELMNFGLRVMPSGVRSYFVQYWTNGRRRRVTLGQHGPMTADQARQAALGILGEVATGEDPAEIRAEARKGLTVAVLAERYLKEYAEPRKRPRSVKEDQRLLDKIILPALGKRKVTDVNRQEVIKLHQSQRHRPTQANRVVALLSKMFNLAEKWGLRPDSSNPCRMVEKFKETKRKRYLSVEELARLGQALNEVQEEGSELPGVLTAIWLIIFTGARLSEITTLKWEHVNLDMGVIHIPESKTGFKTIPLSRSAAAVLTETCPLEGNPYVCPGAKVHGHIVGIQRPWQRIRERAGLEDVRIHDLRHSFASVGAASGLGLPIIGALLGHTQAATTQRYAHLANDPLKAATDEIGDRIQEAMNKTPQRGKVIPMKTSLGK